MNLSLISLVLYELINLSFHLLLSFIFSFLTTSGLPPLFREALVHMCNYRVHIWSELFPSPRMKRLAMGSALVSYCRSFMHELGLWLSGRLEHRGVCEPFWLLFTLPNMSAGYTSHQLLQSMKYSCPPCFLPLHFWIYYFEQRSTGTFPALSRPLPRYT